MTGTWLLLAATLLAVAATYVCCIRPMRNKGGCCTARPPRTRESVDEEIRRTREELRLLREHSAARQSAPTSGSDRRRESIGP
ncbi:hypothetical protein [Streptomyces sp. ISL-100]|uniref:hypothetical protein n=1 Tax=Streptomyces sp. ISL-100 TaxID=2819173 RepID=UPI001BED2714|nr:hypothetical protein [Streptomyces sp. ISL-100]MBT2396001.1 hypothetical protein [Streptomyces sp. ISL-100]